jgi:hypothetical protein
MVQNRLVFPDNRTCSETVEHENLNMLFLSGDQDTVLLSMVIYGRWVQLRRGKCNPVPPFFINKKAYAVGCPFSQHIFPPAPGILL